MENNTLLKEAVTFFGQKYQRELTNEMKNKLEGYLKTLFNDHLQEKPDMFLSIRDKSFDPLLDDEGEDIFKQIRYDLRTKEEVLVINFEKNTIWVSQKQNAARLIYKPAA